MTFNARYTLLWLLLVMVSILSLVLGAGSSGIGDAFAVLAGQGSDEVRFMVTELRLPRLLIGLVSGLALGVSGALLQTLTRNPLAEPGMLGVSAGSAFAVALAILMGASTATLTTLVAQTGALAGCVLDHPGGPDRSPGRLCSGTGSHTHRWRWSGSGPAGTGRCHSHRIAAVPDLPAHANRSACRR